MKVDISTLSREANPFDLSNLKRWLTEAAVKVEGHLLPHLNTAYSETQQLSTYKVSSVKETMQSYNRNSTNNRHDDDNNVNEGQEFWVCGS